MSYALIAANAKCGFSYKEKTDTPPLGCDVSASGEACWAGASCKCPCGNRGGQGFRLPCLIWGNSFNSRGVAFAATDPREIRTEENLVKYLVAFCTVEFVDRHAYIPPFYEKRMSERLHYSIREGKENFTDCSASAVTKVPRLRNRGHRAPGAGCLLRGR